MKNPDKKVNIWAVDAKKAVFRGGGGGGGERGWVTHPYMNNNRNMSS